MKEELLETYKFFRKLDLLRIEPQYIMGIPNLDKPFTLEFKPEHDRIVFFDKLSKKEMFFIKRENLIDIFVDDATTIEKRFSQHCCDAYNRTYWDYYFYRAIRKYGIENFQIIELQQITNPDRKILKSQILELEEKYIKEYNSFKFGYNSNSGGRHPLEVSAETRELQRKIKINDPRTRNNLKKARSLQHPEKEVIAYNYNSGEFIKKFDSIKKASEYYNIDSSGITKVCKGKTNYLGTVDNVKIT